MTEKNNKKPNKPSKSIKPLDIRVELNEKTSKEFIRLKTKWGFHSYAETVRRLITDRAELEGLSVEVDYNYDYPHDP